MCHEYVSFYRHKRGCIGNLCTSVTWFGKLQIFHCHVFSVKFVVPLPDKKAGRCCRPPSSSHIFQSILPFYMLQRETSSILSSLDFLFWKPPNFYLLGDFLRHCNAILLGNLFLCTSLHHQLRAGFCQLSARIHWVKWPPKCVRLSVSQDFAALILIV